MFVYGSEFVVEVVFVLGLVRVGLVREASGRFRVVCCLGLWGCIWYPAYLSVVWLIQVVDVWGCRGCLGCLVFS